MSHQTISSNYLGLPFGEDKYPCYSYLNASKVERDGAIEIGGGFKVLQFGLGDVLTGLANLQGAGTSIGEARVEDGYAAT